MTLLDANLAALSPFTPTTAAAIAAAAIPPAYLPTPGTDGTPTFLHTSASPPALHWLGHTSMPAASATPLTATFDVASSNGLGLSIGTGFEWKALAARLPSTRALFVYEPDPALLRMALSICDLSADLASAKLILFTAASASDDLSRFLHDHEGFDAPAVLHPLPTLIGPRKNDLLTAGEALVRRAILERRALETALFQSVSDLYTTLPPGPPAGIVQSERYFGERPLHRELRRHAAPSLDISRHTHASAAARLRFLADHRPARLLSDLFRPDLAGLIPPNLPLQTCIPPAVGGGFWDRVPPPDTLAPADTLLVHHPWHQNLLLDRGYPADRLVLADVPRLFESSPPANPTATAVIADLPALSPEAIGLTLPTQVALWAAARLRTEETWQQLTDNSVEDILTHAARRAGLPALDHAFAAGFRKLIRHLLIPHIPRIAAAKHALKTATPAAPLHLIGDWTTAEFAPSPSIRFHPFPKNDAEAHALFAPIAKIIEPTPPTPWPFLPVHVKVVSSQ